MTSPVRRVLEGHGLRLGPLAPKRSAKRRRFPLPATLLAVAAFAAPAARAELFVCAGESVRVFADDAGPGSLPTRTISGPTAGINECYAIALDNWHNELWVTTQSTVRVFRATDDGDSAPLRTITGFGFATAVAVDVEADEVYVGAVSGLISVYPRTANGNPTPLRTIQGNLTGLETVVALFVDRLNNELYSQNYSGAVVVFGRLDNGNVAPVRPLATFTQPFGLVVDARRNEVFVAGGDGAIRVHNRQGAALRLIAGSATLLTHTAGLSLLQDGTVLAGNQYNSSTTNDAVFGYPRTQNGDGAPTVHVNFAAPLQRLVWGISSTRALECGEGQTASRCLFRHSFEGGDASDWSTGVGLTP